MNFALQRGIMLPLRNYDEQRARAMGWRCSSSLTYSQSRDMN